MIFNKNYDRSLWLMLSGDEVNRDKIAEIITNIPYELYEQIRKLIENYNKDVAEQQPINYKKDNTNYSVTIEGEELSIQVTTIDDTQKEVVELFLLPIGEKELPNMDLYSSIHLGGFSYTLSANDMFTIDGGLEEYDVVKTLFGNCVKVYVNNQIKAADIRMVNESRMPDKIYAHQLRNQKGINRLIRGRKRK